MLLGGPGGSLKALGCSLGAPWVPLGAPWRFLGGLLWLLGAPWEAISYMLVLQSFGNKKENKSKKYNKSKIHQASSKTIAFMYKSQTHVAVTNKLGGYPSSLAITAALF